MKKQITIAQLCCITIFKTMPMLHFTPIDLPSHTTETISRSTSTSTNTNIQNILQSLQTHPEEESFQESFNPLSLNNYPYQPAQTQTLSLTQISTAQTLHSPRKQSWIQQLFPCCYDDSIDIA